MKRAVWLSGLRPFAQAAEVLAVVGRVDISASSVWRQVQLWGAEFHQEREEARVRANVVAGPRLVVDGRDDQPSW